MIDMIKNPWRDRKGVMVFDIETEKVRDWTEGGIRDAAFRCGVVYSYDEDRYYEYKDAKELVDMISRARALVTYNGEGFDFIALAKHGLEIEGSNRSWKPRGIRSYDIFRCICANRPKEHQCLKFPSLKDMIQTHYGATKDSYDIEDIDKLLVHCRNDVMYTKMLYEENVWRVPLILNGTVVNNVGVVTIFNNPRGCMSSVNLGKCPNCNKELVESFDYSNTVNYGRGKCEKCKKGCYEWNGRWKSKCCNCGK